MRVGDFTRRVLRNLLENMEQNAQPILKGTVKRVNLYKEDVQTPQNPFKIGQVVFTSDGVGTVVTPNKLSTNVYGKPNADGTKTVWIRPNRSKRPRLYNVNRVYALEVVNEEGFCYPVSTAHYNYLINSIDKDVKFVVNTRKRAMLIKKELDRLKKYDVISRSKGGYVTLLKLESKNLWED